MARPRAWGDSLINVDLVSGVQQSINLLLTLTASDTITAVRLVGSLTASPASLIGQIDGIMGIDIGVGVAATEAFGVAGAIPDPNVAGDVPARGWLYRTRMVEIKVHSSSSVFEILHVGTANFDIGASRKVDRGILYMTMSSNPILGTAHTINLAGIVRAFCLT